MSFIKQLFQTSNAHPAGCEFCHTTNPTVVTVNVRGKQVRLCATCRSALNPYLQADTSATQQTRLQENACAEFLNSTPAERSAWLTKNITLRPANPRK